MNKQKFNLHTHTARCGHAEGLDIQYIHSAIDAGLTLLGFSEHIPYPEMHLPACRMLYEQKNEYLDTIRNLQKGFQDKIKIKVGYELEYMNDHVEFLMQMKQECDYMILGQHCREIGYEYDCYCSNKDVLTYVKQIEDALELGIITYVAHPDYFMLGRRLYTEECVEAAHRIARASILHDIPLEINLNGFHYGKKTYRFSDKPWLNVERYPYPFREFWDIVASYGCKVLYGFDAHSPITLLEAHRIHMAEEILEGIPLNFTDAICLR